ncbi:MAG: uroporphyrinogen-III synthase [Alphaproteobacteria bacterium]|jgi:uroporphyrinogen-III synthase|nr:uroporphyrinogen-III synthase [Alphaproteobacteria bacterium]
MTRPVVLITRPRVDAEALAEGVSKLGAEPLIVPMIEIAAATGAPPDFAGVQAVLLTSANGARALATHLVAHDPAYGLPVFCVGDATATAATVCGFANVNAAGGDIDALSGLVASRLDPAAGALFHVAGRHVAGDLGGRLQATGFAVRRSVLYEALAATELGEPLRQALSAGTVDLALFFSPRTTKTFATLVKAAGLASGVAAAVAVCLSEAVAVEAQALPWADCPVAAAPTQRALMSVAEKVIVARLGASG